MIYVYVSCRVCDMSYMRHVILMYDRPRAQAKVHEEEEEECIHNI